MAQPITETLRVAIVGGGIGGAGTALGLARAGFKHVDLYESVRKLGEVGAGINVGPNSYRILKRWDIASRLQEIGAVAIEGTRIIKGDSDKELAFSAYDKSVQKYDAPIWVCHRAELHRAIVEGVDASNVNIKLGCEVTEVDFNRPALKFRNRNSGSAESDFVEYDLVIAADGVKSNIRRQMFLLDGQIDHAQDTGQAAYRILLPRSLMEKDPELLKLIDEPIVTRWIAHRRHIIAYPINNKTIYNISTAHPDEHLGVEESWTSKGSKEAMLQMWHDYCPRVQKMLNLVDSDEVLEWKLRVHHPLKTWVEGKVVLIGDASHPTLPHLAQGAAQALEDAAVMSVLLPKIKSREDIPKLLKLFEKARKARAEEIVEGAYQNGKRMHLASGAEAEARDRAFEAVKHGGPNPDATAAPATQDLLYGFDCMLEAERLFDSEWASTS